MKYFPFLKSTRFWAVVLIGLVVWFGSYGWIPEEVVAFVYTVAGGHVGIRSLDRAFENFSPKKK